MKNETTRRLEKLEKMMKKLLDQQESRSRLLLAANGIDTVGTVQDLIELTGLGTTTVYTKFLTEHPTLRPRKIWGTTRKGLPLRDALLIVADEAGRLRDEGTKALDHARSLNLQPRIKK